MLHRFPEWVRQALASEDEVVYLLDRELRITTCNPGWENFAARNGGVGISASEVRGRCIFDFIPEVLVKFYRDKYAQAWQAVGWTGFDYECSSPNAYRLFHMSMYPLEGRRLFVVNSHLQHRIAPLLNQEVPEGDAAYRDVDGFLSMCAHCRRTQRRYNTNVWDWVPGFLTSPGHRVIDRLCPRCTAYHYPESAALETLLLRPA